MKAHHRYTSLLFFLFILCTISPAVMAQTEQDAVMMGKNKMCLAGMFSYSSWTDYWEGTFKRDNANIGRLSTRSGMVMLNYGLTKNVNVLASVPYISTKASKGTLGGLHGFQDVGIFLKWRPVKVQSGKQRLSLLGVAGFTTPSNKYNIDFMPMSIGMGSDVLSGRLIADIQRNKLFATLSTAYMYRGNVHLDREAYYTTRQINSSEVKMPDAGNFQFRTGYRSPHLIAEAFLDNMTTFGGFDIRKNDMPFVSNKMNSTRAGLEAKYYLKQLPALGVYANAWYTLHGRNVGQSTGYMAGLAYAFDFSSK